MGSIMKYDEENQFKRDQKVFDLVWNTLEKQNKKEKAGKQEIIEKVARFLFL
jgi:hypothetical protein